MGENDRIQKKSGEKKPATLRIDLETVEKFRELCRGFVNQDVALNAIMNVYEREALAVSRPQYTEDMRQFEQYQQCLSAKFTDIIKALGTADERARIEVQKLLDSKDNVIQDLQKRVEDAVRSREALKPVFPMSLAGQDILCYDSGRIQALQAVKDRRQTYGQDNFHRGTEL